MANTIKARPAEIGHRSSFGHWEGDLLAFRQEFGKANLTSLVERCSRFTILSRNRSPPFGRCLGWHRQPVVNLAPFPPAKPILRPWASTCGFSAPRDRKDTTLNPRTKIA